MKYTTVDIQAPNLPETPEGERGRRVVVDSWFRRGSSTVADGILQAVGSEPLYEAGMTYTDTGYEIPGGFAAIVHLYPTLASGQQSKKVRKMVLEVKGGADGLFSIIAWYEQGPRRVRTIHHSVEGLRVDELAQAVTDMAAPSVEGREQADVRAMESQREFIASLRR